MNKVKLVMNKVNLSPSKVTLIRSKVNLLKNKRTAQLSTQDIGYCSQKKKRLEIFATFFAAVLENMKVLTNVGTSAAIYFKSFI